MPIRKKGNIKVQTSPNGYGIERTGYTFYSYDKNSAALYFQFRGQDGQPTDLGKATIHLVMILNDDDEKEFIPKSDEIEVISAIRGTAKYVLPEMLLSYSGKVTGYVYMDFDDGSQSDDGQFTFRIKHSMITHVLPKAGDKYVQDFEDVKERVEQAGDSATKDIEKAKDNAESQIGEYVGEIEKDYKEWKEKQEDKQSKFEDDTNERVNNITERVGEAENKVTDLERHLDVGQKNYFSTGEVNNLAFLGIGDSGKIAESSAYRGYSLPVSVGEIYSISRSSKTNNRFRIAYTSSEPKAGTVYFDSTSNKYDNALKIEGLLVPEDAEYMVVYLSNKGDKLPNIMLNKGKKAHNWTPSSKDIVTKKEYDKLAQAITDLGGSI